MTTYIYENQYEADDARRSLERDYFNCENLQISLRFTLLKKQNGWTNLYPKIIVKYNYDQRKYADVFDISPELIDRKGIIISFVKMRLCEKFPASNIKALLK